jgi:hypothetical protein
MRPVRLVAVTLIAAAAIPATASAAGPKPSGYSYSGSCEQVGAFVPADADAVRRHVPAGWPLYDVGGKAIVLVTGGSCRDAIDGGPQGVDNRFGLVAAASGPPDARLGAGEGYDIWWLHSNPAEVRMFRRAGFYSRGLRSTSVAVRSGLGTLEGVAEVPWSRSAFTVRVDASAVWAPPFELTSYHWHANSYGLSLLKPHHTGFTVAGGTGEVTAAPGSPLAAMLGATHATGLGMIARFDFSATIGPQ